MQYDDGAFPDGVGRSILFDDFVRDVQSPEFFNWCGEDDVSLGRPLPLPRGVAASSRGPRRAVVAAVEGHRRHV